MSNCVSCRCTNLQLVVLLNLGIDRVSSVPILALSLVESVAVIRRKIDAESNLAHNIRVGDPQTTKHNRNVLVLVLLLDGPPSTVRLEATSDEDRRLVRPQVDGEIDLLRRLNVRITRNARLHDVQVRQLELLEPLDQVAELRHRVLHAHALEARVRAQADTSPVGADSVDDGLRHLEPEPRPVLDAAAPLVVTLVARVLRELVDQVAVCAVDLDAVEAGLLDCVARRGSVVGDEELDLVLGQGAGLGRVVGHLDRGRGHEVVALGLEDGGVGGAAERPQLHVDVAAGRVHAVGDLLPGGELGVGVEAWDVGVAAGARGDEGGFGDEEGAGHAGALGVVFLDEGQLDVVVVGAEAGQRGHDEAVGELIAADLEGLEELAVCGHCEGLKGFREAK